jgi:phosphoribosylamine--glycine ligase
MVVTGTAATIDAARAAAYRRAGRVIIPNARYRLDIGQRLDDGGYRTVGALGLLDELSRRPHAPRTC